MPRKRAIDLPQSGYDRLATDSAMGRTREKVRCHGCGSERWIYVWSWAGHGLARCGSDEHALLYLAPLLPE